MRASYLKEQEENQKAALKSIHKKNKRKKDTRHACIKSEPLLLHLDIFKLKTTDQDGGKKIQGTPKSLRTNSSRTPINMMQKPSYLPCSLAFHEVGSLL